VFWKPQSGNTGNHFYGIFCYQMHGEVDITEFLKHVNMKVVIEKVAVFWDEISAGTIRKSRRKLIPLDDPAESSACTSQCSPLSPDDGTGSQNVIVAEF